ncbi:MATE family efflux transporter [Bradyrhizobium genosp. SA-3]|uniref:MATE family efflux transporter n=1 Tax=Bradyrhizobium genosp. SA-3 TaxID=508868 RepID=UPI0010290EDD|nr:MATE family efflux transporter [Bradyrhizobium genosp. SA-3]RZN06380.1 MATE family efflux transporter [Bradyrhizobium genosp. SA-3]
MDNKVETKSASASHSRTIRRTGRHQLAVELSETVKLALPMVLVQLGQIAMMMTDVAFIGQMGDEALAATALAGRVYLVSFTFGAGLVAPITMLTAQAFGADNLALVRRSLRMGLWVALMLSLPVIAFALRGEQLLFAFDQEPDLAWLAQQYLFGLSWGVAPALSFLALRNFMGAVKRPEPILWITLAAIPVNALLAYLLIYGKLGLPRLELFGAGLATSLVNCGTFLAGLWFTTRRPFREYQVLAQFWRFDWLLFRQLIVTGTPISIASLIGYGMISAAALLSGWIGINALAAFQIVLQVAAILFMISFGISTAATVRVSQAVGRNDGVGVKRAGLTAIMLGMVIATILSLAVIPARFAIVALFLGESAGDPDTTIGLAVELLLVSATLFITDAVGSIAAGGLRGIRDTRVPLLLDVIAYWLIGFPFCYILGFKMDLGAIGIWIGLSVGTTVRSIVLVLRFRLLANKLAFQSYT